MKKPSPTKLHLIDAAAQILALHGYEGVSMRLLAQNLGISQSVIYHHFSDKDALLLEMYLHLNKELGNARARLKQPQSVSDMFRQRIEFQMDHATEIIAVLKYYLHFRDSFKSRGTGSLPEKTSLHIDEIIAYGTKQQEIITTEPSRDAKVITHAINGYLLEYYPYMPKGKQRSDIVDAVTSFALRALRYTPRHSHSSEKTN